MKYSWRKSNDSLMDGLDNTDVNEDDHVSQDTPDEVDTNVPKHVHFGEEEDSIEVVEIINAKKKSDNGVDDDENDNPPITEEEAKQIWYQEYDFRRFEKDRVLTSMDYANARKANKPFVEDEHSIRGIEHFCDPSLYRRQTGERRDLYKALQAEEERQKIEGTFPDLEKFRSVSLKYSKSFIERALAVAGEDAREQQREMHRSSSMSNLFRRSRGRSTNRRRRCQSIG